MSQVGISTAFIMSTNHAIIPASVCCALLPLCISDLLESSESCLRVPWEEEETFLPYSPIAKEGPPFLTGWRCRLGWAREGTLEESTRVNKQISESGGNKVKAGHIVKAIVLPRYSCLTGKMPSGFIS